MAKTITYKIIGAGESSTNPIVATVGCDDTTVTICWIGRTTMTDTDNCQEMYTDGKYCETVDVIESETIEEGAKKKLSGSSTTTWNEQTVYYSTIKECDNPGTESCTSKCSDLTAYVVPRNLPENTTSDVEIYYEYWETCEGDDGYVGSRVRKSGVSSTTVSENDTSIVFSPYSGSDCSETLEISRVTPTVCEAGASAEVSVSFSVDRVPASGGTVDVIFSFVRKGTDEDCNEEEKSGIVRKTWEIPACTSGESDSWDGCAISILSGSETLPFTGGRITMVSLEDSTYKFICCEDHYVSGSTSLSDLLTDFGLSEGDAIYYDGVKQEGEITYSIIQKAKRTDECEGTCEPTTTYCVKPGSVKVYYETEHMSDVWAEEGSVPSTGGRIKVTWDYSTHSITSQCVEFDNTGEWEEIIEVGSCNERPAAGEDGVISDAECKYDENGGTCEIYFKEQTPGCTFPNEELTVNGETITFNKITYSFTQDCKEEENVECKCSDFSFEEVERECTIKVLSGSETLPFSGGRIIFGVETT